MQSRREFLRNSTTVLAGTTVTLLLTTFGCSNDDGTVVTTPAPTEPSQCGSFETSNVVQGHSHTVCVPQVDLTSPPINGATYVTSTNNGHAHTISLSEAQLMAINAGQTVVVETSTVDFHTHGFALVRAATAAPAPAPAPAPPQPGPY